MYHLNVFIRIDCLKRYIVFNLHGTKWPGKCRSAVKQYSFQTSAAMYVYNTQLTGRRSVSMVQGARSTELPGSVRFAVKS